MASYTDGADEPMSEIPGIEEIQESYLAFETLLDSPENTPPTGNQRVVKGTVLAANHSDYTVAINGHKVDALLPRREAGNLSVGDKAEFIVVEDGGEEAAVLSYTRQLAWTQLTELAASGNTCKVRIDSVSKRRGSGRPGGLNVSFRGVKGFIPHSHVANSRLFSYSGPDDRGWGEPSYIDVTVLKAEHDALVFSQKGAIKKVAAAFIEGLTAGDIIPGLVTSIYRGERPGAHAGEDFEIGAFVEIAPGVSGLVHKSDLGGYCGVSHILPVGKRVMVQVIAVDSSTKRVSLSYIRVEANRQALDAEALAAKLAKIAELITGQTLLGRVKVMLHKKIDENSKEKRCNAAIITLPNGVDALLHYSDCMDGQMDDIRDLFKTGDEISVFIKGTDLDNGRVQLGYA
jgi:ribosomal protein S1